MKMGPDDKGFCVTEPFSHTLYVSAVFNFPQPVNLAAPEQAWMKFLGAKYGYEGDPVTRTQINPTYSSIEARGDPARIMAARVAGAAAGRKVMETSWNFGAPKSERGSAAYELPERVARYDADMEIMHPNRAEMAQVALDVLPLLRTSASRNRSGGRKATWRS